jgi:hypothetical protein
MSRPTQLCLFVLLFAASVSAQLVDEQDAFRSAAQKFCGLHRQTKRSAHRDRLISEFRHEPAQDNDTTLIEMLETDAAGRTLFTAELIKPNYRFEFEGVRMGQTYFKRIGFGPWRIERDGMMVERWAISMRASINKLGPAGPSVCGGRTTYRVDIAKFKGMTALVYSRIIRQELYDQQEGRTILHERITSYWLSTEGSPLRSQSLVITYGAAGVTLRTTTFEHEWDDSISVEAPMPIG